MNTTDLELRLKQAAALAAPPHSVVDAVMDALPSAPLQSSSRPRWRSPLIAAALTGIAAILALTFLLAGPTARLTLADIQTAVENQQWVHVRWDVGQLKERWTNLQTGQCGVLLEDGADYVTQNPYTNILYRKNPGTIKNITRLMYPSDKSLPVWTPHSAWQEIVAPFEKSAAATQPVTVAPTPVTDTLAGHTVIRLDQYETDSLGNRFLYAQLWADPQTHLPLRIKTRLQLAEREQFHQDWSTGDYDFPTTGPSDIYALGVPRDIQIHDWVTTAPADVQPIVDAITHAHDNFIKNYRAIVIVDHNTSIIWRDGPNLREDFYDADPELLDLLKSPDPLSANKLLAWTSKRQATVKQLMDTQHEYFWSAASVMRAAKPQVQVTRHTRNPMLASNNWPEFIQWPSQIFAPNFHLLPQNPDTPAGCLGLRMNGEGTQRTDFYVDPQNDYVCIKTIGWTKRGADWFKERQYTLANLHRIAGHIVATTQIRHDFGDPAKNISPNTQIITIHLTPLAPADYPTGTFDPTTLTNGATIEGY